MQKGRSDRSAPFAGDQRSATLIALGDHLEKQFRPGFAEWDEAESVDDQQLVACDPLLQAQPIAIAIDPALLNTTVLQFSRSSQNRIANLMSFGTPPLQRHCQSQRKGLMQIGSHVKRGSLHTPFSSDNSDKSACSPPNMSDTRFCRLRASIQSK